MEKQVVLTCAVYGKGFIFPVHVSRDAAVSVLLINTVNAYKEFSNSEVFAADLTLYIAKKTKDNETKWLISDETFMNSLEQGRPKDSPYKTRMIPNWPLVDYLGENFQPGKKEVHVLVEVKDLSANTNSLKVVWQTTTFDPPVMKPPIWWIDCNTIVGFGLHCSSDKMALFCRSDVLQLFEFLEHEVILNGHCGYILGPPGSGKSVTAAAFALIHASSHPDDIITWIHLSRVEPPVCVRLKGNTMKASTLVSFSYYDVFQILNEVDVTKNHFVFLDGVALNNDKEQRICRGWLKKNTVNRRLVVVTSMSARGKTNMDEDAARKVKEHFVSSWKLDEFFEAVEDTELFKTVKPLLDASDDSEPAPADTELDAFDDSEPLDIDMDMSGEALTGITADIIDWRHSLVRSKYYFAGGSARYMFSYRTADVVSSLEVAVDTLLDVQSAAKGSAGDRSSGIINRLFCRFRGRRSSGIISQFAGSVIAMIGGPVQIKKLASILHEDSNDAMDGWILEMYFFACLRKGGVTLYDGEETIKWPEDKVLVADPKNLRKLPDIGWLKPHKFNQGGYDAIYINKEKGLVRFVQVTRAHSHKFHIHYFNLFMSYLLNSTSSFEVTTLEIYFVIEMSVLPGFKFSTVTGQGLLAAFPGWEWGNEQNKVRCVGIEGVDDWNEFIYE